MSSQSSAPARRRSRFWVWFVEWTGLTYVIAIFLVLLVIGLVPSGSWSKAYRILGLSLNVGGGIMALTPRFMRGPEQIEEELAITTVRERLRRDTIMARWGLTFLVLGFFVQLFGALVFG